MKFEKQKSTLNHRIDELRNLLITTALNYERKISGPTCGDIYQLRNSLTERLFAIGFHIEWLTYFQSQANHVTQKSEIGLSLHQFVNTHQMRSQYLFDDIIFNLMSLFDYFSVFAGYVFYGDQIRNRAKGYNPLSIENKEFRHLRTVFDVLKWRNIAELANPDRIRTNLNNLKGNALSGRSTAKQVVFWDTKLVSLLREYRNDLIHNQIDGSTYELKISIGERKSSNITIGIPVRFKSTFQLEKVDNLNTILDAGYWVVNKALDSIKDLLEAVDIDIEETRKVPRGAEHISWEGEEYPRRRDGI